MDRVYFKTKAKQILQNNFWYLTGIVIIVALLTMDLIGVSAEYTNTSGYYEWQIFFHLFNFDFKLNPPVVSAMVVAISFVNLLVRVFIKPVIEYGRENIFKYASLGRIHEMDLFSGFKYNYGKIVMVNLVKSFVIFAYSLLFVIPGIMKSYELRYVNEILEEHPDWGYQEVFAESKRLTNGMRMELFVLDFSFVGWALVAGVASIITLGLASYAYQTYPSCTNAEVYLWLKNDRSYNDPETVVDTVVEQTYL